LTVSRVNFCGADAVVRRLRFAIMRSRRITSFDYSFAWHRSPAG
jgi:hypothetical protein